MDVKDYMEENIESMIDKRSKFDSGSKDELQHDKNIVEMFKAYNERLKLELDEKESEKQRDFEKKKYEAEIECKNNEVKKKTMADWGKTAAGVAATAAGVILACLSRKDEREGFIVDDKIPFFDKLKSKF